MENLMQRIKKMNITSMIFSVIFIIIGFFLILKPEGAINFVAYVLGVMLIIWGVVQIVQFFTRKDKTGNFIEVSFIGGLLVFILGIVFLIKPKTIASIVPLLLGVWMIADGVLKFCYALTVNKRAKSIVPIILSVLIVIAGLFLVFNPFEGAEIITQVIGVVMIVYSILVIVECLFVKQLVNTFTSDETGIIEVEIEEKTNEK